MPPWGQVGTLRDGRVVRMRIYPEHADASKPPGCGSSGEVLLWMRSGYPLRMERGNFFIKRSLFARSGSELG
jgi:hypothetical protein